MTQNCTQPKTDQEAQFRRLAERNAPPVTDFSEGIMNQILTDIEEAEDYVHRDKILARRKPFTVIIAATITLLLLSGFGYTAIVEGWLILKDEKGQEIMSVSTTDLEVPSYQERITELMRKQLQPGEEVAIMFGEEAIRALDKRDIDPYLVSMRTVRGYVYKSYETISVSLIGELLNIRKPSSSILGTSLTEIEVVPELGSDKFRAGGWSKGVDKDSGNPYAFKSRQAAKEANMIHLTYTGKNRTFKLNLSYVPELEKTMFYDSNPSSSRIHEVEGVQVYNYSNPSKDEQFLIWSRPAEGGHFSYVLKSDTDIDEQLEFAKEVVKNY